MQPSPIRFILQRGIFIGFIVNILVVLATGLIAFKRNKNLHALNEAESKKNEILYQLEKLQSSAYRLQNLAKGYAISGDEKYLDRFRQRTFELEKTLQSLHQLVLTNPEHSIRLAELEKFTDEKIKSHNQLIELSRYKGFEAAKNSFSSQKNLELNDKIDKSVFSVVSDLERSYLRQKIKTDLTDKRLGIAFTIAWVFGLVLLVAVLFVILHYLNLRKRAELLLQGNKQLLQSIINNTTNPVFVKELGGQYILANTRFSSLFRDKYNDITGKTDHQLFSAEIADKIRSNDLDVIKAGKELRFEEELPEGNESRTYLMVKFPILNAEQKVYAIGGIATDISEHKRTEIQLIENEAVIQAIFDSAPEAVIMLNENSEVVKWNKKAELLFKWKAEEVSGKAIYDFIIPEKFKEAHMSGMKKFLDTGGGPILNRTVEMKARNKDGEELDVEISVSSNIIKGKHIFIAFVKDIRERKKMEADNRRSKDFLDSIIDNIPDMVFVKNAKDLRFVRLNKAGERLLGFKKEELLGKNDYDFFPKEQADFFTQMDRKTMEAGELLDIEEEAIDTKSGKRWLHTKKITIKDEKGQPMYLLGISEDISKRKSLEDERDLATKELEESQNRMELILENIGEGVVVADTSQHVLLYNQMAGEILRPKELGNFVEWTKQYNIYYPDGRTVFPAQNLAVERALRGEPTNDLEIVLEDPQTKKRKRLLVTGRAIRNQDKNIIAAVTTFKDITRFKEMERALHESELKYRNLIGFRRDEKEEEERVNDEKAD